MFEKHRSFDNNDSEGISWDIKEYSLQEIITSTSQ